MVMRTFYEIDDSIAMLAVLESGPAYEAFRESLLNDFLEEGWSRARAAQVT
jgi:hypothetical protein